MRFAIQNTGTDFYAVFRITDNGASTDTVAVGSYGLGDAAAEAWVNMGAIGSGAGRCLAVRDPDVRGTRTIAPVAPVARRA